MLGVLLLTAACGSDGAPRAGSPRTAAGAVIAAAVVQNGIAVVEHDAAALDRAPQLMLSPTPIATVGDDANGTFDLTDIDQVVLLADGRIVTRAAVGSRLLVFGADGRGQRRLGRDGAGPGEFSNLGEMARLDGDTLLVVDAGNARFSWWLPDGALIGERSFAAGQPIDPFATVAGALPDGRLVMHSASLPSGVSDRITRPAVPVVLVDGTTGARREIALVPGREVVKVEAHSRGHRRLVMDVLRFGRSAHVIVWDSLIVTAAGEGYVIDVRRTDGRVALQIRVRRPRRVVTSAMREARIAEELEQFDHQRERRADPEPARRLIREAPFADSLPPYSALFETPDRTTLWVVDARAPTDSGWAATAFRADGAITGRLIVAGPGRPVAFGNARVVVRTEDADGVVSLRVHRIVAAVRGPP